MKWFFICFLFLIQSKIYMSEGEKVSDKIVHNFLVKTKTKDFCPIGTGGGLKNGKINLINISYSYKLPMTIKTARGLMVHTASNFLKYANNFPNIKEYLNDYPLDVKNLNFGIIYSCWLDIPTEIKCITLVHGIITYSIEGEKEFDPYIRIHKESFEEAEKIVAEQNLNK